MNRRDCLTLLGAGGLAAGMTSGCDDLRARVAPLQSTAIPARPLPSIGDIPAETRLLNRAGFGPAPGDLAGMCGGPHIAWLDTQLAAPNDDSDEPLALRMRLRPAEALSAASPYDLQDLGTDDVLAQMQQAAILRAVYSPWQVRERMVDFWSNHFNVYGRKNMGAFLKSGDDVRVIRTHALGYFPDMLRASAHSPAMLGYLDNQQNRSGVPNENYARELMELHTLGVKGGYTQKDVLEVARCLTGWTIEDRFLRRKGEFRFDASRHDDGPKTVLGVRIPAGGGESDGDRVLDLLATHPATAQHVSRKLVRHFVGDSDALTMKVASVFAATQGSAPAMLRCIVTSPEFRDGPPLLKRPYDFLISSLRATGAETDAGKPLQNHLARMGQPLFQWPMPDGYPDKTESWTGTLLHRWNFAVALAGGGIHGSQIRLPVAMTGDERLETVMGRAAHEPALQNLRATVNRFGAAADQTALLLASPAFQWR
jgi:uncharacterized protein (DUF1800 family)